ncbi:tRNA (adenine(37)-N6)-methyltransferase-like [Liolophura sinensis]|uniref:tRNA (adenine(37)-N6)-methyltransferase-like n=1 Tax=Liolophura sinensis TaxID=3198878 RepID=UPI0031596D95
MTDVEIDCILLKFTCSNLNCHIVSTMTVPFTPIGFIKSVFKYKNGTPRQSQLCRDARGVLTIEKTIFNNPEHSLEDLDSFTHVWILFLFHKNSDCATKAKVRPPRLGGKRVGVFSTRSPHRPNPIGLTLAKLDAVKGDKMYISGIDIIDGTPVLDVKPYIQEYDTPHLSQALEPEDITSAVDTASDTTLVTDASQIKDPKSLTDCSVGCDKSCESMLNDFNCEPNTAVELKCDDNDLACSDKHFPHVCDELSAHETLIEESTSIPVTDFQTGSYLNCTESEEDYQFEHRNGCEGSSSTLGSGGRVVSPGDQRYCRLNVSSSWIPSVDKKLQVRFTQPAVQQLSAFSKSADHSHHRLALLDNAGEAKRAIISMLTQDPRSIYRRQKCPDSLYFFTVDKLHVTCWFDQKMAEVVRIQSVDQTSKLLPKDEEL